MNVEINVLNELRTARISQRKSQKEVAEALGLTPTYVSLVEKSTSKHLPTMRTFLRWCEFLNVEPTIRLIEE